jgi:UDP-N-acetylmuramate--alanine ligase
MTNRLPRFRGAKEAMGNFHRIHLIGIGGSGMSGIAEVLLNLGFLVSGSDQNESQVISRLRGLGAKIFKGHAAENIVGVNVVVSSSAIKLDNPELLAAKSHRIPVIPRAEMLGELMRFRRGIAVAGTHGKTTTTSLTASLLAEGGLDPTFVIGGLLNSAGTHAKLGSSDYLVAEADESDGSFLLLQPVIAIVTNIDADHLENFDNDFNKLRAAFVQFLHHLPFYGLAVLCIEDPYVAAIAAELSRPILTYGFSDNADVYASEITQVGEQMKFTLNIKGGAQTFAVTLNLPGLHNVLNACAAAAVAWHVGVAPEAIAHGLQQFRGVGRRFHIHPPLAIASGQVMFVDDYGHHPRELAAVLAAARGGWPSKRLVVAFQPHRYSRTRALLEDFAEVLSGADQLLLTEVYAAGETPIAAADGRALARAVRARGRVEPVFVGAATELLEALPNVLQDGDLLLLLGAGDIGALAQQIEERGQLGLRGTK